MKKVLMISILVLSNIVFAHSHPGFLCVIEGIEAAGKTTLLQNLKKKFEEFDQQVLFTREPGATELGQKIRTLLLDDAESRCNMAEFLLFAADRAQHFAEKIVPALQAGTVVISDRMADSSLVYQGYVKGVDRDMIQKINAWCMQGITPDVVIYLRITPEQARQRILTSRGQQTKFEQDCFDRMHILFDAFEEIFAHRANVLVIDALQEPDLIAEQVFDLICSKIFSF
jgi:dTMP kinase